MNHKIDVITIERVMTADKQYGWYLDTIVHFHRRTTLSTHHTNPILSKQNRISDSSVRRAKRAQAALVERGQRESEAIE